MVDDEDDDGINNVGNDDEGSRYTSKIMFRQAYRALEARGPCDTRDAEITKDPAPVKDYI